MKSAGFSSQWLAGRLAALLPTYPDVSLCVALSGGLDSVALLAAAALKPRRPASVVGLAGTTRKASKPAAAQIVSGARSAHLSLRAIHVHHGLHPNADQWARHCRKLAARFGVSLEVIRVRVSHAPGDSLEAAARDARYAALADRLKPGEVLLTAHHQDDQLETVFLQLLRGAGIAGLAAMPEVAPFAQGQLVRPLLPLSRAQLEAWARQEALEWIEDDTNANEHFDRNFLRRSVLPLIRSRWPGAAGAVSRTARHAAEAKRLLDSVARADVERASVGAALSVQSLRTLNADRRRNALRFWISRSGFAAPDTRRLEELAGPVLEARADAHPEVQWDGTVVSREGDALWISGNQVSASPAEQVTWDWRASPQLELSAWGGTLEISPDRHGPLDLESLPATLGIRSRQGGERLRVGPRARTRTLKALLQEARIPTGQRSRLPLVYSGDQLIAVADRWIDVSVCATDTSPNRARLIWRMT